MHITCDIKKIESEKCYFLGHSVLILTWATSVICTQTLSHYLAKRGIYEYFFWKSGWKAFFVEPSRKRPKSVDDNDDSMLCKRVVTKDRRYITQITCYEKGKEGGSQRQAMRMPLFGKQGGGVLSSLFSKIGRQGTPPLTLKNSLIVYKRPSGEISKTPPILPCPKYPS